MSPGREGRQEKGPLSLVSVIVAAILEVTVIRKLEESEPVAVEL